VTLTFSTPFCAVIASASEAISLKQKHDAGGRLLRRPAASSQ
jgi:hypothetical protein